VFAAWKKREKGPLPRERGLRHDYTFGEKIRFTYLVYPTFIERVQRAVELKSRRKRKDSFFLVKGALDELPNGEEKSEISLSAVGRRPASNGRKRNRSIRCERGKEKRKTILFGEREESSRPNIFQE